MKNVLLLTLTLMLAYSCNKDASERSICFMDDGPFTAETIQIPIDSIGDKYFDVKKGGKLYLRNDTTYSMPVFSLVEDGELKWSILMLPDDGSDSEYDYYITEIRNVKIKRANNNIIKLTFNVNWNFGGEFGRMIIDRETAVNSFCLSW